MKDSFLFRLFIENAFPIAVIVAIILAFTAGGIVRDGMFMGFMSTLAIWFLVVKFPPAVKRFMAKYVLLFDLILSVILFATFTAFIGPGPTVLMTSVTQAVMLSVLLSSLKYSNGPLPATLK